MREGQILGYLKRSPGDTIPLISKTLLLSESTTQRLIVELERKKLILATNKSSNCVTMRQRDIGKTLYFYPSEYLNNNQKLYSINCHERNILKNLKNLGGINVPRKHLIELLSISPSLLTYYMKGLIEKEVVEMSKKSINVAEYNRKRFRGIFYSFNEKFLKSIEYKIHICDEKEVFPLHDKLKEQITLKFGNIKLQPLGKLINNIIREIKNSDYKIDIDEGYVNELLTELITENKLFRIWNDEKKIWFYYGNYLTCAHN